MEQLDRGKLFVLDPAEGADTNNRRDRPARRGRYRSNRERVKNPLARIGAQLLDFVVCQIMEVFLPFLIELFAGLLVIYVVVAVAKEIVAWWWRKDVPEC